MKAVKISISMFILFFLMQGISISMSEKDFPQIGSIKKDGVNVKAGDNENFENLCNMEKGEVVTIIGKRYSWYKIVLPKKAYLYIKDDYVDMTSEQGIGIANATRINLRVGPSTKYSIIGQVSKPQILNIVAEGGGWYKIEPPENTAGWVKDDQVKVSFQKKKEADVNHSNVPAVKNTGVVYPSAASRKTGSGNLKLSLEPPKHKGNLMFSTKGD